MYKSLSDNIRDCREGVLNNPYQGKDKKVVFVCSMGILRSATGARLYAHKYNTRSAGTWDDALIPLSDSLMLWADEVVFVNKHNYDSVCQRLEDDPELGDRVYKKFICLDIPDNHPHMDPELIKAFNDQYEEITNDAHTSTV